MGAAPHGSGKTRPQMWRADLFTVRTPERTIWPEDPIHVSKSREGDHLVGLGAYRRAGGGRHHPDRPQPIGGRREHGEFLPPHLAVSAVVRDRWFADRQTTPGQRYRVAFLCDGGRPGRPHLRAGIRDPRPEHRTRLASTRQLDRLRDGPVLRARRGADRPGVHAVPQRAGALPEVESHRLGPGRRARGKHPHQPGRPSHVERDQRPPVRAGGHDHESPRHLGAEGCSRGRAQDAWLRHRPVVSGRRRVADRPAAASERRRTPAGPVARLYRRRGAPPVPAIPTGACAQQQPGPGGHLGPASA